jgi:hypothetical protein
MFRMPKNAFFAMPPTSIAPGVGAILGEGVKASSPNPTANTAMNVAKVAQPLTTLATLGVTAAAGLSSIWGGGSKTESGLKLPPELELQMLRDGFQNLQQIRSDYQKADTMYKQYESRFNLLAQSAEANVPPEEVRRALAKNSADIALSMGQSIDDVIKNGFLSAEDKADIESLVALESQDFRDPAYDQARAQQKQQMMANLQRSGASPQQISQALTEFDNASVLGAFSRGEELRASRAGLISNRIGMRQGLQQGNFNMALGAMGAQQNVLSNAASQLQGAANLSGMGFQAAQGGLQTSQALRAELQNQYSQFGEYKFSKTAKKFLGSGESGFQPLAQKKPALPKNPFGGPIPGSTVG